MASVIALESEALSTKKNQMGGRILEITHIIPQQ
jgi:hypothetical protein